MDFRNVTDLFADPAFDGEPIRIKNVREADTFEVDEMTDVPVFDEVSGEEILFTKDIYPNPEDSTLISGGKIVSELPVKYYVNGVDVNVLNERVQYLDGNGKLITMSLRDYTRKQVCGHYASLDDFLTRWQSETRKTTIIDELAEQGIVAENFQEAVAKEMDIFDLICHVAFDQPPLSRAERVNQVKKRNYFVKYGDKARQVLESLLDKYANEGITTIEDIKVLTLTPLNQLGSPMEIINLFGGKSQYLQAIAELEQEIYQAV
jgi:type I restriction enzyme R subunit